MNIEIETRLPREIRKIDPCDGSPTEMFYYPPLVKIDYRPDEKPDAICFNGRWFEPTDNAANLDAQWDRAKNPIDRSVEFMIRDLTSK